MNFSPSTNGSPLVSSSEDEDNTEVRRTGIFFAELRPCDVLLGRGTGPTMNEGNVHFRNTVEVFKSEYVSTASRKEKKEIVRRAVNAIKAKDGRFLTRLKRKEIKSLGMKGKVMYELASDNVAMEKTKQAIRYVHHKKLSAEKTQKATCKKVVAKQAEKTSASKASPSETLANFEPTELIAADWDSDLKTFYDAMDPTPLHPHLDIQRNNSPCHHHDVSVFLGQHEQPMSLLEGELPDPATFPRQSLDLEQCMCCVQKPTFDNEPSCKNCQEEMQQFLKNVFGSGVQPLREDAARPTRDHWNRQDQYL